MIDAYQKPFRDAAKAVAKASWFGKSWRCHWGLWPDEGQPKAVVFKLLKPHWTNDTLPAVSSESGLFFSVWVDEESAAKGRLKYNVHALKLRGLKAYALESRKFAAAFREGFQAERGAWPNVSTDFGPQTLFEGFVEADLPAVESQIVALATAFLPIGRQVDELLSQSQKDKARAPRMSGILSQDLHSKRAASRKGNVLAVAPCSCASNPLH